MATRRKQLIADSRASIEPVRFRRYSRQEITLHNLLATRRPTIDLKIAEETLNLTLGPLSNPPAPSTGIALSVGGSGAWLNLSKEFFSALTVPWAVGEEEALPPMLHDAVLHAALNPLLRELRTLLGARISLRDEAEPPPQQALQLGLWETTEMIGEPSAALILDADSARLLNACLEDMASYAEANWPTLAIELTLSAGQTHVSTQELVTLENGDILLFPAQIDAATHEFTLYQHQSALAAGQLEGRQLIINRLISEATMSDPDPFQTDEDEPLAITGPESLEITLRFDLGQLTLPLDELQQIQPGYSFELDLPAPGEVRIVTGGQLIGRGELVQIEDRLGVRVTTLFSNKNV